MRLRRLRRDRELTQEQLAKASGVNQTTISDLENGRTTNPSWETIARIAKALHVDPHDVFPIDGHEANPTEPDDDGPREPQRESSRERGGV